MTERSVSALPCCCAFRVEKSTRSGRMMAHKWSDRRDRRNMSVFGDFQQVWFKRFPDSALPAAWEEDVRANLAKHKQKVSLLREELEKEEFYVEYLERLLSDVEEHKRKIGKEKAEEPKSEITDKVSKVNT